MEAALRFMAEQGIDLVVTSGGLGPTADDLTAEVVGGFQGREMVLDEALEERIAEIVRAAAEALAEPRPRRRSRAANRKQATIPEGATVLEPVGTAPGPRRRRRADGRDGPTVVVLPGPAARAAADVGAGACETEALRAALRGRDRLPPADAAAVRDPRVGDRRDAARGRARGGRARAPRDHDLPETRRDRGRHALRARRARTPTRRSRAIVRERHADTLFSDDGSTVDEQVAGAAARRRRSALTIATAESCTGGLLAARLTDLPGASDYVQGGVVAYSNEVKVALAGVAAGADRAPRRGLRGGRRGARRRARATRLRRRRRRRRHRASPGPGGGSEEKPVGLVWLSVAGAGRERADALGEPARAAAPTCATARRPWRCTCSAARCSAHDGRARAASCARR